MEIGLKLILFFSFFYKKEPTKKNKNKLVIVYLNSPRWHFLIETPVLAEQTDFLFKINLRNPRLG